MRRLLLPLSLLLLAAAAPPDVPAYKTFGRWVVACDNVRSCEARGFDEGTRADLRLIRDAGSAQPRLVLTGSEDVPAFTPTLDGKPLDLSPPAWTLDAENHALSTSDPATVDAFIAAARNATALGLGGDASIPLQGFTAALLFVDAVQNRPGTPAALVAPRGNNGVDGAPGLPGRPAWHAPAPLSAAEARQLLATAAKDPLVTGLLKTYDCDSKDRPGIDALDAGHTLVIIPCALAAYQSSSLVVIMPRAGGPAAPFDDSVPGLPHDTAAAKGFLTEPDFDAAKGELSETSKGRGLADCGLSAAWVWSGGAFRIVQANYLDPCGGAAPGDWLTLYRTAPRR